MPLVSTAEFKREGRESLASWAGGGTAPLSGALVGSRKGGMEPTLERVQDCGLETQSWAKARELGMQTSFPGPALSSDATRRGAAWALGGDCPLPEASRTPPAPRQPLPVSPLGRTRCHPRAQSERIRSYYERETLCGEDPRPQTNCYKTFIFPVEREVALEKVCKDRRACGGSRAAPRPAGSSQSWQVQTFDQSQDFPTPRRKKERRQLILKESASPQRHTRPHTHILTYVCLAPCRSCSRGGARAGQA